MVPADITVEVDLMRGNEFCMGYAHGVFYEWDGNLLFLLALLVLDRRCPCSFLCSYLGMDK
jgi:hypothetical protein